MDERHEVILEAISIPRVVCERQKRVSMIGKRILMFSLLCFFIQINSSSLRNWLSEVKLSHTAASMLAGSFAGAIGVGVSFPLDTLKTKSQVLGQASNLGMIELSRKIFKEEGLHGFFGGVRGMMIGQAVIKSAAFTSNQFALESLNTVHIPMFYSLLLSAAFAGFVTSFIVAPVERVKIMMQAAPNQYVNEFECMKAIFKIEGIGGFLGRGLNATIVREVPSYCIYFALYGMLMKTPSFVWLGNLAPLVAGALSGMGSWLPVYPVDVVKSLVQNTDGKGDTVSSIAVAMQLYKDGGVAAFFDGLQPKMIRAGVNHAVTFWVYEICIGVLPLTK